MRCDEVAWDISSDDGGAKIDSYTRRVSFFGVAIHHIFNRLLQFGRNTAQWAPISEVELRTLKISGLPCGRGYYAASTG